VRRGAESGRLIERREERIEVSEPVDDGWMDGLIGTDDVLQTDAAPRSNYQSHVDAHTVQSNNADLGKKTAVEGGGEHYCPFIFRLWQAARTRDEMR